MKAPARSISLAILICFVLVMEDGSHAQPISTSAAAPTLPPAGLTYGTTRYFNQLTRLNQFVLVDINKDGVLDLVAPQFDEESIAISLGDAAHPGTFLPPTFVPTLSSSVNWVTVADLNGDGFPDLVYCDNDSNVVGYTLQNPLQPGTFIAGHYAGAGVAKPLVADMNHDGVPDLILFQEDFYQSKTSNIAILPGDPAHPGSFLTPTLFPMVFNDLSSVAVADMNGDGLPDIVVGNDNAQSVSIFINDPAHPGTLLPRHDYPAHIPIFDLAVGDLNGDGHPDVVVGGVLSGVGVLLGSGSQPGTLLPASTYAVSMTPEGGRSLGIALGDINGDGKLDVVSGNYGPVFDLLLGIGDGTLAAPVPYETGPTPDTFAGDSMAVGDVDGDGLQDVLVGQFYQNSVQVFTHRPIVPSLAITATDQSLSARIVSAGQPLTITIKVSAFQGVPQGSVTLYESVGVSPYVPVAVLPLDSTGTATFTKTGVTGFDDFFSFFPGDTVYAPSTSLNDGVASPSVTTPLLTLAAAPNPAAPGQDVALTARISPNSPLPTGTITFLDAGITIGSAALDASGTAVFHTSTLAVGTHTLTATFPGDANYAAQQASTVELIRNPVAQFSVVSSLNPAAIGQPVTFTAKVAASSPAPTGGVSFTDNATPLATVPLAADGSATYTTSALAQGSHLIRATYSGDTSYGPLTDTLTEAITGPAVPPPTPASGDFTLTAGPPLTLQGQQNGAATLTVTPLNGLSDTIALSCGSLPLYVTCQIAPAAVSLNGTAPQQATIQIATGQSPAFTASIQRRTLLFAAALPFLLLPWPRALTRTRLAALLLLAPLLGGLLGSLAGCGFSKSPISTPPGTYSIVLSGRGASSRLDRSTTLTLIVK